MPTPDPQDVYEALLEKMKTKRSKNSLEAIHEVCREHRNSGALDFRIATIVRLGADRGVPSEQTIKNKTGEAYRALIHAWQESLPKKQTLNRKRDDWVSEIEDPRLRFLVEDLVVKNRRLERQISELKKADFTIDLRDATEKNGLPEFIDSEVQALKQAISPEFLDKMGWSTDSRGRILDVQGKAIYAPGYVTAIERCLTVQGK